MAFKVMLKGIIGNFALRFGTGVINGIKEML